MLKLSQVCKNEGVTRRTLQEYDKIGLLSPTSKTEAGYWLYDDDAVERLRLIQIFVTAGYERKRIMKLLNPPSPDLLNEFDKIIEILEEKKRVIEGKIHLMTIIREATKLPRSTLLAMQHIDQRKLTGDMSFAQYLTESVDQLADLDGVEKEELGRYTRLEYFYLVLGALKSKPPESKAVRAVVRDYYSFVFRFLVDEDWFSDEDVKEASEIEKLEALGELTKEVIEDYEMAEVIALQSGEDAYAYILNAVDCYSKWAIAAYKKAHENEDDGQPADAGVSDPV